MDPQKTDWIDIQAGFPLVNFSSRLAIALKHDEKYQKDSSWRWSTRYDDSPFNRNVRYKRNTFDIVKRISYIKNIRK